MAIELMWDDADETIVRWTMAGKWTWKDFWAAVEESTRWAEAKGQRVDILVDFTAGSLLPDGALSAFSRVERLAVPGSTEEGLVVIAGGNRFAQTLLETFRRIYRVDTWRTAPTLDAGRALIAADRAAKSSGAAH